MTDLNFRFSQDHVPQETVRKRLKLARLYVAMTRVYRAKVFPGLDPEAMLVGICVFIGDAEGRSTTVSALAAHSGLSRQTVYRRLKELIKVNCVSKVGTRYYRAERGLPLDPNRTITRILDSFMEK